VHGHIRDVPEQADQAVIDVRLTHTVDVEGAYRGLRHAVLAHALNQPRHALRDENALHLAGNSGRK